MPMLESKLRAEISAAIGSQTLTIDTIDPVTGEPGTQQVPIPAPPINSPLITAVVQVIPHIQKNADIDTTLVATTTTVTSPSAVISPLSVVAGGIPGPGTSLPTPCPVSMPQTIMVAMATPDVVGAIK